MRFTFVTSLFLFCFFIQTSFSQHDKIPDKWYTVEGILTDSVSNEPLIGVTVLVKGTNSGAITDSKGYFSFKLKPGEYKITTSYIGYESRENSINLVSDVVINISISPKITTLGEVTITSQKKFFGYMEYGREIPTINAELISKQNSNNASDILHARLSGVWATKTSGAPGDHEKIRIRGQNSLFSSAEPLYVVDGVPVPIVNMSSMGIADLNIYDIENVTVLKDASSSALYGFQGGNGVILIDTKKGGENRFNFAVKFGHQWFNHYYDLMSTKDQLAAVQKAWDLRLSSMDKAFPDYSDSLCNHNRQDEVFKKGFVQEYQLSKSGKFGLMKYYFSGNYLKHDGIITNMGYERYTFSTRLGWLFWKRLAIEINYRGSNQENINNQEEYRGNSLLFHGISQSPCLECLPDTLINPNNGLSIPRVLDSDYILGVAWTPDDILKANTNRLGINTNAVSGFARLQLTNHLNIDVMESFMSRNSNYENKLGFYDIIVKSDEDVILFNHQANLSYYNNFGMHNIGLVIANRFYRDNLWWQVDTVDGYVANQYILKNSMAAYGLHGSVLRTMVSYIAHLSYDFDKIVYLSAIANLSKIKEGKHVNYYQLFPSVALSFNLAQLQQLRGNKFINALNIFINYGQSGNYPLNGLANDFLDEVKYSEGNTIVENPYIGMLANHNLRHENTKEANYGIKTGFFNKRFSPCLVYYDKKISDLIMQRDIPSYYGGGKMFVNVGEIAVKGIDFSIEAIPVERHNFSWEMVFNFSKSSQKVTKLIDGNDMAFPSDDELYPNFYIKEGRPLGDIYGYKCLGRWTDDSKNNIQYVQKGDLKFLNADTSNRILNINDFTIIGNSIPDYTWNITNTFSYKDFSVEFTWYAAWGLEKFNATRAATYMTAVNRDINNYINDTIRAIKFDYFYRSSMFIDDASFIKLKSLSFTYEPSRMLLEKLKFSFTLSFENLITITKYKGYDPEATIFTDNNFSDNSIDRGSVPNPKAVFFSINLKF